MGFITVFFSQKSFVLTRQHTKYFLYTVGGQIRTRVLFFQEFSICCCEVYRKIFPGCLRNHSWENIMIHFATAETESLDKITLEVLEVFKNIFLTST